MSLSTTILPAALLTLTCATLAAEDPRFGVQAALSVPTGDLSDSANFGLQGGGHVRWDFGRGHGLMVRADATFYTSKNGVSTNSLGAGADYTYHFDQNRQGPYLLAGLSMLSYSLSFEGASTSRNGLGLDLGAGYDLNRNLGLQVRYTTHNIDSATLASLNLGVTYTF